MKYTVCNKSGDPCFEATSQREAWDVLDTKPSVKGGYVEYDDGKRNPPDKQYSKAIGKGAHTKVYGSARTKCAQVVTAQYKQGRVDISKLVVWRARQILTQAKWRPATANLLPKIQPLRAECQTPTGKGEFIYGMPLYTPTHKAAWRKRKGDTTVQAAKKLQQRIIQVLDDDGWDRGEERWYDWDDTLEGTAKWLAENGLMRVAQAVEALAQAYAEATAAVTLPPGAAFNVFVDLHDENFGASAQGKLVLLDPLVVAWPIAAARKLWEKWTGMPVLETCGERGGR